MLNEKAAFIVGCVRSGTTVIKEALNRHEKLAICSETHYFTNFKKNLLFSKFLRYKMKGTNRYINYLYNMINDNNKLLNYLNKFYTNEEIVRELASFTAGDIYHLGNSKVSIDDIYKFMPQENLTPYEKIFKSWIKAYAHKKGKNIIPGEKTPLHIFHIKEIQKIFPTAYFIHCIRDPCSTMASLKKVPWASKSIKRNLKLWDNCRKIKLNEKYIRIYFENFVEQPEVTLRKVCNFLDIPFDSKMLKATEENDKYSARGEYWKKNANKKIAFKNITSKKEELTKKELSLIENFFFFFCGYNPDKVT